MRYFSKKKELCLVMHPTDRIVDEQRRVKVIPGKRIEFFNGLYETSDPEIIAFLDKHPYRGHKFQIIKEEEKSSITPGNAVKVATGMLKTTNAVDALVNQMKGDETDVTTRPTDRAAISPELIKVIDDRINSAMSTIIALLQKDTVKAEVKEEKVEKMLEGKPTKSFKCPFCGEPFKSGFDVGKHKKVCPKRS